MSEKLEFQPKYPKIVEALLYITHQKPGIDHYHACKLIYLADREHLNRYGRPVVSDRHLAMRWGPVASKSLELIKQERQAMSAAKITELPFKTEKVEKAYILSEPKREVDKSLFSKSDIKILDEVIRDYANLTMGTLHDITAEHPAYKTAWESKSIFSGQAEMPYETILDESDQKAEILEDMVPVAKYMR